MENPTSCFVSSRFPHYKDMQKKNKLLDHPVCVHLVIAFSLTLFVYHNRKRTLTNWATFKYFPTFSHSTSRFILGSFSFCLGNLSVNYQLPDLVLLEEYYWTGNFEADRLVGSSPGLVAISSFKRLLRAYELTSSTFNIQSEYHQNLIYLNF